MNLLKDESIEAKKALLTEYITNSDVSEEKLSRNSDIDLQDVI